MTCLSWDWLVTGKETTCSPRIRKLWLSFWRRVTFVLLIVGSASLVVACTGPGPITSATIDGRVVVGGGHALVSPATLDLVNGTTAVVVKARSLGGALYRVSTPPGSGIRPLVSLVGRTVEVALTGYGAKTGVPTIDIAVASGVHWTINLDGGATTEDIDMSGGRLTSLNFDSGVSMASVRLPAAVGTERVTLAGGASVLAVEAPAGAPAQIDAQGGASEVQFDGVSHTGVAAGSVFTEPGFAGAENRYAITLTAGVSDFRMVRT